MNSASLRVFKTVCKSPSKTAKSPTTSASSGVPAKAAHVLTPMLLPTSHPQGILTSRPIVTLYIPLSASPFCPKTWLTAAPSIELFSGKCGGPERFCRLGIRRADLLHFIKDGAPRLIREQMRAQKGRRRMEKIDISFEFS